MALQCVPHTPVELYADDTNIFTHAIAVCFLLVFLQCSVIMYCYIGASVDGQLPFWCGCFANKVLSTKMVIAVGL